MKRESAVNYIRQKVLPRSLVSSPECSGAVACSCPSFAHAEEGVRRGGGPVVTMVVAIVAAMIEFLPRAAASLQLDRAVSLLAEPWRVVMCHLCHFGRDHFSWDIAVFVALGLICERFSRRQLIQTLVSSALLIPILTLSLMPSLHTYRGLSGIDSALFGLLAAMLISENLRNRQRIGLILSISLLVAFALKLIIEMRFGVAVFADSAGDGYIPVPLAHLIGLLAGATIHALATIPTLAGRMVRHDAADAEFAHEARRRNRNRAE